MAAITINVANFVASSQATRELAIAGETITQGQPLYTDVVNNVTVALKANWARSNGIYGLAESGASANQYFTVIKKDPNLALGGPINSGNMVLLGNTGTVVPVEDRYTGMYIQVLGVGIGQNRINFSPVGSNVAAVIQ